MSKISSLNHSLTAAIVQLESQPGQIAANQAHARPFIETAGAQKAQLIILPELFACGYIPNQSVWQYGETLDGPTVTWLRQTAARLGVYLGAGFVEVAGNDFYNSFALATPDGELAGCARKTRAETYCFRYNHGHHLVETALGRIGIGICADNHYTAFLTQMRAANIDLLLMPHASPTPHRTDRLISEADIARSKENATAVPTLYARLLGVPVLFANAIGGWQPMTGLLGRFLTPELFRLQGQSCVVDSDGRLSAQLDDQEGILVATVTLNSARSQPESPPDYGGWLHPGVKMVRKVIIPLDVAGGRLAYFLSRTRRQQARRSQLHR
jgi:N-carbamoylputrescine amidase